MTTLREIITGLQTPTPRHGIGFIPRSFNESIKSPGTYGALAVPYVEHGWIRQLLDDICGPFGWQIDTKEVSKLICVGIGILNPETNEWIWKWSTGQDEPFVEGKKRPMQSSGRGIFSLSFKRAAYQWGIGSDVLKLKPLWVPCTAYMSRKDNEMKFKDWAQDPITFYYRSTQPQQPQRPSAGTATVERKADRQTGEVLSPQASESKDLIEMKNKCYAYADTMCGMSAAEATKFIQPYIDENGKNVLAYQLAWNGLMDHRKQM